MRVEIVERNFLLAYFIATWPDPIGWLASNDTDAVCLPDGIIFIGTVKRGEVERKFWKSFRFFLWGGGAFMRNGI